MDLPIIYYNKDDEFNNFLIELVDKNMYQEFTYIYNNDKNIHIFFPKTNKYYENDIAIDFLIEELKKRMSVKNFNNFITKSLNYEKQENKLKKKEEQIKKMRLDLIKDKVIIDNKNKVIEEKDNQNKYLQEQIDNLYNLIQDKDKKINKMETKSLNNSIDLSNQIYDKNEIIKKLKNQLNDLKKNNRNLNDDIIKKDIMISILEEENIKLKTEIKNGYININL